MVVIQLRQFSANDPLVKTFSYMYVSFTFRAVLMNIPGQVILGVLTSMAGIVVFAHYAKVGCDPMSQGKIKSPNQVIYICQLGEIFYYVKPG